LTQIHARKKAQFSDLIFLVVEQEVAARGRLTVRRNQAFGLRFFSKLLRRKITDNRVKVGARAVRRLLSLHIAGFSLSTGQCEAQQMRRIWF
jgi:hypothetical protein